MELSRPEAWILLVGDTQRGELREARTQIESHGPVVGVSSVSEAIGVLHASPRDPLLMVVAQSTPNEIGETEIAALRRAAPITPCVALLGSWCEGEPRTGRPWPGVVRVYWYQWPTAFNREYGRLLRGERSPWSLVATASDSERLLVAPGQPAAKQASGTVAVWTACYAMYGVLSAACRQWGLEAVRVGRRTPAIREWCDAAIYDAADNPSDEAAALGLLKAIGARNQRNAALVALADYPRTQDLRRWRTAGVRQVLAKPFLLDDLQAALLAAIERKPV